MVTPEEEVEYLIASGMSDLQARRAVSLGLAAARCVFDGSIEMGSVRSKSQERDERIAAIETEKARASRDVRRRAVDWLSGHDTGRSSKAMCRFFLTGRVMANDYPYDVGDFGRCVRLLQCVPEWRSRIGELAALGPVWGAIAANWEWLETLYEEEMATARDRRLWAELNRLREVR